MDFFYWLTHQFGSMSSTMEYATWYGSLVKPFFAPEPYVFGIAWGIIYPLITIAIFYSIYLSYQRRVSRAFLLLFFINIALNLTFTVTALTWKNNVLTSFHIILVLGTLAWLQIWAYVHARPVFWLLVPYLLWGTFATILQISITALN